MSDQCAQAGPRGGRCRNQAELVSSSRREVDFCAKHNAQSRGGTPLFCSKCDRIVKGMKVES